MRARRTDGNHASILAAARAVGAVVRDVHALPGMLDAWVGFRGVWTHVEIKDGILPPSRRALTPAERECIDQERAAGLPVVVIESVADLWRALGIMAR